MILNPALRSIQIGERIIALMVQVNLHRQIGGVRRQRRVGTGEGDRQQPRIIRHAHIHIPPDHERHRVFRRRRIADGPAGPEMPARRRVKFRPVRQIELRGNRARRRQAGDDRGLAGHQRLFLRRVGGRRIARRGRALRVV